MSDENERFTVAPETSRHLVHSINDSPVSSIYTDEDVENDASLAIGATVAAICATRDGSIEINDYSGSSLVRTMGDGCMNPSEEYPSGKEMTSEELKQAIVSMMLRKDEVEERNRSLQQHLEKEMMKSASLRFQLEDLKRDMSSKNEENCVAFNSLKSENDLLKHQLKKYVGAVQSLKRNDIMEEAPENERLSSIILSPESDVDEVRKEENKDFERKLIQVADMHGELIELNERLQKC
ncbi:sorting nexin-29-like isoform X1 [Xenia sp. Carnegie-2017]|uniref:sorting nexin-29-like isoform X1 n=1 Tax=Xenia sp. Carnegie-2017 TaxID=2897299 RepID=UPI001F042DB0|nr:sorting nexin-29-like isoform X1 [Xenia sp. Carnegie-2017]